MHANRFYTGWINCTAFLAALCAGAVSTDAQTLTAYSTGFDGTDYVNGAPVSATYNSPITTPTDPLSGQNGWTSNDQMQTGTGSTQLVGQSDFVGSTGTFSGQNGALGGIYRTSSPTTSAPDVVPSTNSGGIISLSSTPFTVGAGASMLTFDTDFVVTASSTSFPTLDTFGFSLRSASGVSLITVNFNPATVPADQGTDFLTTTVGANTITPASQTGITLGSTYHLTLTVTPSTNTFLVTLAGSNSVSFSGSMSGESISVGQVTELTALWNLTNKNATGTAYDGAGDNYLAFDNIAVTVPEPSTDAMISLGLVGLMGMLFLKCKRA